MHNPIGIDRGRLGEQFQSLQFYDYGTIYKRVIQMRLV